MNGPLAGIMVLDLSRLLPGPYCTQLLVDLGADVVKVEDPIGGDYLRHMPPLMHDGTSALFHAVNRGKKSVALDLKSGEGHAAFLRLCARADVVVESFRPGVMDKLGLSPSSLRARFPRLIVCSISGYGQEGPDRLRAGHDINYVARAGVLGMMAAPTVLPVQVADLVGGAWPAALQIVAALLGRASTGQGAWIDVSMTEGAFAMLAMSLARAHADDGPLGDGHDLLVGRVPCYGVYPTSDGFLAVGALEPKFWSAFVDVVGLPELRERGLDDGAGGDDVRAQVTSVLRSRTTAEWDAAFRAVDACVEPVHAPEHALRDDTQLRARGAIVPIDIDGRVHDFVGTGLHLDGACASTSRAPRLGEHNALLEG